MIFRSLKYVFPKCTFSGPKLNRLGLVWYLLNSSKTHALRGLDKLFILLLVFWLAAVTSRGHKTIATKLQTEILQDTPKYLYVK